LAEWGVVIDDPDQVMKLKAEYWDPMWKTSHLKDDCDVQAVMDGLNIDRSAPQSKTEMTLEQLEKMKEKIRATANAPAEEEAKYTRKKENEEEGDDDTKSEVSEAEE
jgi:hypothetical protein